tara:strand:- start:438 stop:1085 length:648 start_codon:yes stop_codon:yes gene_type:complete
MQCCTLCIKIKKTASVYNALYDNTSGESNTASGVKAMWFNTIVGYNPASGKSALAYNTTGNNNTALGYRALWNNTTGQNNIGIGYDVEVPPQTGNNQVRIGNASITYAGIQVPWTTTNDKRWKSDIQNSSLGLNFISKLLLVSYFRNNDESKKIGYGFISIDDQGMDGVRYNDLIAPMVKAIQEQQEIIETLEERIVQLEKNKHLFYFILKLIML